MKGTLALDKRHTALLIMDYQNDVVTRFAREPSGLLERASAVLAAARAAPIPVIYVAVRFRDGYPEVSPRNRAFAGIRASGRMIEGTPGTEIHSAVAPRPDEPVVVKRRVGAFGATDLATILRAHGVTTLILMGIATSGVVLSTVRYAADLDYDLVVVEDCCADADEEVHRVLTQKIFPRQATVTSSSVVIAALER